MNDKFVSSALKEVWEWKDAAWKEVEHLPIDKALEKRIIDANDTVKKLGLKTVKVAKATHG